MNLVVLSHLEPILYGKRCYLLKCWLQLNYERCTCLISKTVINHVAVLSTVLMEALMCIRNHNDFFVNRPSYYMINQQSFQWAAHMVPWVASTYL